MCVKGCVYDVKNKGCVACPRMHEVCVGCLYNPGRFGCALVCPNDHSWSFLPCPHHFLGDRVLPLTSGDLGQGDRRRGPGARLAATTAGIKSRSSLAVRYHAAYESLRLQTGQAQNKRTLPFQRNGTNGLRIVSVICLV